MREGRLAGRWALVTGSGRGAGMAIARRFAEEGANVAVHYRTSRDGAESVADEIRALGRESLVVQGDTTSWQDDRRIAAELFERLGRLDILVNNVGGVRYAKFLDLGQKGWHTHTRLNFDGLFGPTDAAVRAMIAGGRGGVVLNVASIEALRAAPMFSVYAACKAGMVNFTRSLALELADHGIRVNAIAPDIVDTPHLREFEGSATGGTREARERGIPLRRPGTVEDCANACIFLASDMASYITGVTLSVDGGTYASSGWTRNPDGSWGLFH